MGSVTVHASAGWLLNSRHQPELVHGMMVVFGRKGTIQHGQRFRLQVAAAEGLASDSLLPMQ
jgi:hypothetical protein